MPVIHYSDTPWTRILDVDLFAGAGTGSSCGPATGERVHLTARTRAESLPPTDAYRKKIMQTLTETDNPALRGSFRGAGDASVSSWLRAPIAVTRAIGSVARRVLASYQQYRKAKGVRDALRQLDDRMLRDLGFHRDEIDSVAAEFAGQAERTRIERR